MKIISWNIAHQTEPWRMLAKSGADVALVQEAGVPPSDVLSLIRVDDAPWASAGCKWRAAVVGLSERVEVRWRSLRAFDQAGDGLEVSRCGMLAIADVEDRTRGETITLVSMYGKWERSTIPNSWIYADASVHRVISDLSVLIDHPHKHRVLAAGDLNILNGYGERGDAYWKRRYGTVFDRFEAIGLPFVGPQAPNGHQAVPKPKELPEGSLNVPTYRTRRKNPATATRQLDFVFASRGLHDRVAVSALNAPEEWGPSDHCRVEIHLQ